MTATENAEGHRGRFGPPEADCGQNTSGSGWYRAFRSELLAAQHPTDPATSSLADGLGRSGNWLLAISFWLFEFTGTFRIARMVNSC